MKALFAAAGLETLITLLIFVAISALSAWLKRKQAREQKSEVSGEPTPTRQRQPAPARRASRPPPAPEGWEEELRRLLEGEPAPPPPPPVIVQPARRATPPPIPASARREPASDEDMEKGLPVKFTGLLQSRQAYQQAHDIERKVEEQFRRVDERVAAARPAEQGKRAVRAAHPAVALLRDRASLRSAVVASVVLGPAKAFEG